MVSDAEQRETAPNRLLLAACLPACLRKILQCVNLSLVYSLSDAFCDNDMLNRSITETEAIREGHRMVRPKRHTAEWKMKCSTIIEHLRDYRTSYVDACFVEESILKILEIV